MIVPLNEWRAPQRTQMVASYLPRTSPLAEEQYPTRRAIFK